MNVIGSMYLFFNGKTQPIFNLFSSFLSAVQEISSQLDLNSDR